MIPPLKWSQFSSLIEDIREHWTSCRSRLNLSDIVSCHWSRIIQPSPSTITLYRDKPIESDADLHQAGAKSQDVQLLPLNPMLHKAKHIEPFKGSGGESSRTRVKVDVDVKGKQRA